MGRPRCGRESGHGWVPLKSEVVGLHSEYMDEEYAI
jgi:hypothetical protein